MPKGITKKSEQIRATLVDAVHHGLKDVVAWGAENFGITRQAVNKHLAALVREGRLEASGNTRARTYSLGPVRKHYATHYLAGLDEHLVHRREFGFVFDGLPDSVSEICHYGFTEMLNNAIDHSEGVVVSIFVERDRGKVELHIGDDGEGIFKRIARLLDLADPREAILELSKGKLTTDPDNHTGEGIFFTSRAFDSFHIDSVDLCFSHVDSCPNDYLLHNDDDRIGTFVFMEIALDSTKDLGTIFDEYSSGPDESRFERTVVPVRMALYEGERLVSRSQAKRILNRVERFKHVLLDFEGVDKIGQAFADETFRVFARNHPAVELVAVNTTPMVDQMIARARAHED